MSEAESEYRKAWNQYRHALDDRERRRLCGVMDSLQPHIAKSAFDKRWVDFTATLPGYQEFWDYVADISYANICGS